MGALQKAMKLVVTGRENGQFSSNAKNAAAKNWYLEAFAEIVPKGGTPVPDIPRVAVPNGTLEYPTLQRCDDHETRDRYAQYKDHRGVRHVRWDARLEVEMPFWDCDDIDRLINDGQPVGELELQTPILKNYQPTVTQEELQTLREEMAAVLAARVDPDLPTVEPTTPSNLAVDRLV